MTIEELLFNNSSNEEIFMAGFWFQLGTGLTILLIRHMLRKIGGSTSPDIGQ